MHPDNVEHDTANDVLESLFNKCKIRNKYVGINIG